jgi:hypothetical protein
MAITAYIQINFGGSPTNPAQAATFQLVTPWGQTQTCTTWEEAVTQAFQRHSRYTGKMGNYFLTGTTNGLSSSISGSATANDIVGTDYN